MWVKVRRPAPPRAARTPRRPGSILRPARCVVVLCACPDSALHRFPPPRASPQLSGYLNIPQDGAYTLQLESTDGSRLSLSTEDASKPSHANTMTLILDHGAPAAPAARAVPAAPAARLLPPVFPRCPCCSCCAPPLPPGARTQRRPAACLPGPAGGERDAMTAKSTTFTRTKGWYKVQVSGWGAGQGALQAAPARPPPAARRLLLTLAAACLPPPTNQPSPHRSTTSMATRTKGEGTARGGRQRVGSWLAAPRAGGAMAA